MKRVWCRPQTVVQKFEANEYVAACGMKTRFINLFAMPIGQDLQDPRFIQMVKMVLWGQMTMFTLAIMRVVAKRMRQVQQMIL